MTDREMKFGEMPSSNMVMLVDDQPIVGEAILRLLSDVDDLSFHYCQDPALVLDLIDEVKPAVILLDILMPDIDGITLLRYLRENPQTASIPVVMLSSKEEGVEKAAAFDAGANDYLVKIPEKSELIARLRYHAKYYSNILQRDAAFRALKISQKKLAENNLRLQEAAIRDALTNIYNRRYFDAQSPIEWARAIRQKECISVVLLDIDYFKKCNDIYGHAAGDECLRKVAQTLAANVNRKTDFVARIGGEEFAMLLPNTDRDGAFSVAEALRQSVEALQIEHKGSKEYGVITISAGVCSVIPDRGDGVEDLLRCADLGLYKAKSAGRNCIECSEFSTLNEASPV